MSLPTYEITEVKLAASTNSKISSVSLYSHRAEVKRLFKVNVSSGQNQVVISELPNVLDHASLRVEGRGAATIHEVTVMRVQPPKAPTTSTKLEELYEQREATAKALERCKSTLAGLQEYLKSVRTNTINVVDLVAVMDNYNTAAEKYDNLALDLERKLKNIRTEIEEEKVALSESVTVNKDLLTQATIGVFAQSTTTVDLVVTYAVPSAGWSAKYEIRAKTDAKEESVELVYKAAIWQSTGEIWKDVPLTLETAAPTFGHDIPSLDSWTLSVYRPQPLAKEKAKKSVMRTSMRKRASSMREEEEAASSDEDMGFGLYDDSVAAESAPVMAHASAAVTSQGGVNATFRIPGVITVPSDGIPHNVTIASIVPEAKLSWVAVPSVDTHVHLTTNVKNTSEYTLLSGESSVYVDGTFVSKSRVPLVSPQESFTCSLGLDPSIRITYHPRVAKASQSGLINKTSSTSFSQRVTVQNTKTVAVENLKITDRVPIARDSQIVIKVTSPELVLPNKLATVGGLRDLKTPPPPVKVAQGIVAQWQGADQSGHDTFEWLGKDGKFDWICSIPAQKKVDLNLQWEVSAPIQTTVVGL